ncbi:diguanylate cyclase [Alkalibacter saccharofermentans]|uniref:PAS domain S-box-containing protein/diguanylate cyclase (GGDEF) domain-containing protein n=1 Tax=Alkalibacter saccharofermentans DSM 14828 TaxID=1120975 RepID=A0A1M5A4E3_9FIRM|nr:diguanylate cyclase [Alkalibacter saccharofermentans]SHF24816.1 PAS domain S-box-containing protein/diguanylate cyclase (GGDEF) domain-containing protein [Alkalibacter saccharofermentans DSM 14828]
MERVLLLIGQQADQKILKEFLSKSYEVVLPDEKMQNNFDLLIADYQTFNNYRKDALKLKKEANPVFLPILLLVSSHDKNRLHQDILNEVDEFISMPVNSYELKLRITNLLRNRALSLESETQYYTLAESIPAGICVLQNERIAYCNPALSKILSKSSSDLMGASFLDDISPEYSFQIESLLIEKKSRENIQTQLNNMELKINTLDGEKWVELSISNILYRGSSSVLIVMTDVTERKLRDEEIRCLSLYDKLTGIFNRAYMEDELKRLNTKRQLPLSIIMADINGLKLANDAYGHEVGDQLLIRTAKILKESCRQEDVIARWGGDEFIILLPQTSKYIAGKIASRIIDECSNYYIKAVPVKMAIGVATKINIQKSIKQLLIDAEDRMYKNKLMNSNSVREDLISTLLEALKEKSEETEEHAKRISELCFRFQEPLDLTNEDMDKLSLIAIMHDIGKISVSEDILKKPDKLTFDEWEEIRKHPETGYRIACASVSLAHIAQEILSHHERWDGKGYPFGIKGGDIPILARIIAIVDAFDVMTNGRVYKPSITKQKALKEIKNNAGTQFDPDLVQIFLEIMEYDKKIGY